MQGAGGTRGGLGTFLLGAAMIVVGGYLLLTRVTVASGYWQWGGTSLFVISQEIEVSNDELVLTSGLGGGYPSDIPVGRVTSIRRRDFEIFQQAVIQPAVDFEQMQIVLVITAFPSAPIPIGGP